MLASDEIGGYVVDPDHVGYVDISDEVMMTVWTVRTAIEGDSITTPDILRVDVCEANILNDDVLCTTDDADTLSLDDTIGTLSDQGLVGANSHAQDTSLVISDAADFGCIGLVVRTPIVLVDCQLAGRASAPWSTSGRGDFAFGTSKVKCFSEDDDSCRGVGEVANKLTCGCGINWSCTSTTSHAL